MTKKETRFTQFITLKERQKLLANLMKLSALIIFITSIPDFYFLIWESVVIVGFTLFLLGVFYYFNQKGKVGFTGNALTLLLSVIIFVISSQLGFDSLSFLFYIPLIIVIPFVIDYKNKYIYYLYIAHPILFIAALFATDFSLMKMDFYDLEQMKLVAEFNIIGILVFCYYVLYLIIQSVKRSERKFEIVANNLSTQNIELQKINNELDRFVYSVSHDLRSPLASSLGLIELSKQETSLEKLLYYNLLKEKSLKRLDDYVNSLIDFSRNYRIDALREEIDFKTLLDQCIELNTPYGEDSSRVSISKEIDQQKSFLGDSLRIRIILNNLLSNALKYYDESKEWSVLKIKVLADDEHVTIKFIDNGVGIEASLVQHVFDMFYRASGKAKGSGLGLYITKEVVGKLNGTITVESVLGEGSSFTVDIPNQK
jgi:signal transduction histidine kinase